jgi:hypothetical protein
MAEEVKFDSRKGQEILLNPKACRADRLYGKASDLFIGFHGFFLGVKRLGNVSNWSYKSGVDVKKAWDYVFIPRYALLAWYLLRHRGDLTFTL